MPLECKIFSGGSGSSHVSPISLANAIWNQNLGFQTLQEVIHYGNFLILLMQVESGSGHLWTRNVTTIMVLLSILSLWLISDLIEISDWFLPDFNFWWISDWFEILATLTVLAESGPRQARQARWMLFSWCMSAPQKAYALICKGVLVT